MSKLEDRENRRRSTVGKIVGQTPMAAAGSGRRGRPKEDRELKKRISLSVLPSLYEDIQKIAYVQRKSTSEVVQEMMEDYRKRHIEELDEYGFSLNFQYPIDALFYCTLISLHSYITSETWFHLFRNQVSGQVESNNI